MHVSAIEEYGVRCALQLASHTEQGPIAASKIAEKEGISVEYVSKIMHLFRKTGIVKAERGTQGGFILAKDPEEISLKEIFATLQGKKDSLEVSSFCSQFTGNQEHCLHTQECSIRPVWMVVSSYFDEVLKSITLKDLLVKESESRTFIGALAAEKAKQVTQKIKKADSHQKFLERHK